MIGGTSASVRKRIVRKTKQQKKRERKRDQCRNFIFRLCMYQYLWRKEEEEQDECRNIISNLLSFLLEKKLQAASSQCTASCTVRNRILACWASYGGTMVTNNQAHRFISYGEMFRLRHENEFRSLACTRLILRISRLAVLRISLIEWMKMWWMNVWEREEKKKRKSSQLFNTF